MPCVAASPSRTSTTATGRVALPWPAMPASIARPSANGISAWHSIHTMPKAAPPSRVRHCLLGEPAHERPRPAERWVRRGRRAGSRGRAGRTPGAFGARQLTVRPVGRWAVTLYGGVHRRTDSLTGRSGPRPRRAGYRDRVLRTALRPRWLALLALALALASVFAWLGTWQLDRARSEAGSRAGRGRRPCRCRTCSPRRSPSPARRPSRPSRWTGDLEPERAGRRRGPRAGRAHRPVARRSGAWSTARGCRWCSAGSVRASRCRRRPTCLPVAPLSQAGCRSPRRPSACRPAASPWPRSARPTS